MSTSKRSGLWRSATERSLIYSAPRAAPEPRGLRFDGSTAGRAHVADGDELHVAARQVGDEGWSNLVSRRRGSRRHIEYESDRQTGADQQSAALIA